MEKKIKPHTMQTFQAVICECDLFAGRSGSSDKLWQLCQVVAALSSGSVTPAVNPGGESVL